MLPLQVSESAAVLHLMETSEFHVVDEDTLFSAPGSDESEEEETDEPNDQEITTSINEAML